MTIKYYRLPRISRTPSPPLEYLRRRQDMGGASLPPYPEGHNTDTKSSDDPPVETAKRKKSRKFVGSKQKKNGWLVDPKDVKDYIVEDDDLLDSIVVRGATLVKGTLVKGLYFNTVEDDEPKQKRRRIEVQADAVSTSVTTEATKSELASGITGGKAKSSSASQSPKGRSVKAHRKMRSQSGNFEEAGSLSTIPENVCKSSNLPSAQKATDNDALQLAKEPRVKPKANGIVADESATQPALQVTLQSSITSPLHDVPGLVSPVRRSARQPVKSHKMRGGSTSPTRIEFFISRADGLTPSIKMTGRDIFKNGRWYWEKLQSKILNSAQYNPGRGEQLLLNCKLLDISQLHRWETEFESNSSNEIVIVNKNHKGKYPPIVDDIHRILDNCHQDSIKPTLPRSATEKRAATNQSTGNTHSIPIAEASPSTIVASTSHDCASATRLMLKNPNSASRATSEEMTQVPLTKAKGKGSLEFLTPDFPVTTSEKQDTAQQNEKPYSAQVSTLPTSVSFSTSPTSLASATPACPSPTPAPLLLGSTSTSPVPTSTLTTDAAPASPAAAATSPTAKLVYYAVPIATSPATPLQPTITPSPTSVNAVSPPPTSPNSAVVGLTEPAPAASTSLTPDSTREKRSIKTSPKNGEDTLKQMGIDASPLVLSPKSVGSLTCNKKPELQLSIPAVTLPDGLPREIPRPPPYRRPENAGSKNGTTSGVQTTATDAVSPTNAKNFSPTTSTSEKLNSLLVTDPRQPVIHSPTSKEPHQLSKVVSKSLLDAISMKVHLGLSQPAILVPPAPINKETGNEKSKFVQLDTGHNNAKEVSPPVSSVENTENNKASAKRKWLAWDFLQDDDGDSLVVEEGNMSRTTPPINYENVKMEISPIITPPGNSNGTANNVSQIHLMSKGRGPAKKTGFLRWEDMEPEDNQPDGF